MAPILLSFAEGGEREEGMPNRRVERIQRDLEQRGVAPDLSASISRRLERVACDLAPEAYEALLSGVVAACAPGGPRLGELRRTVADLDEVHRLMKDFARELSKLEEALGTLTAYVTRLRSETTPADRAIH